MLGKGFDFNEYLSM